MRAILSARSLILLADMGIPMIIITLPGMLILLLPVIVVEAVVISRRLSLPINKVFKATAAANASSTIVGVPVTWGLLFLFEGLVMLGLSQIPDITNLNWNSPLAEVVGTILSAPWIGPSEESASWAIPLAILVLLIPFFFASVLIERRVMKRFLPPTTAAEPQPGEISSRLLEIAVRDANLVSYGFLFVGTSALLIWGELHS